MKLAMMQIPSASSVAWLTIAALGAAVIYFSLRLTAKRRFYRAHNIVRT
jgi:hypothetical protein